MHADEVKLALSLLFLWISLYHQQNYHQLTTPTHPIRFLEHNQRAAHCMMNEKGTVAARVPLTNTANNSYPSWPARDSMSVRSFCDSEQQHQGISDQTHAGGIKVLLFLCSHRNSVAYPVDRRWHECESRGVGGGGET